MNVKHNVLNCKEPAGCFCPIELFQMSKSTLQVDKSATTKEDCVHDRLESLKGVGRRGTTLATYLGYTHTHK